jgi:hypothetical protein
MSTRKYQLERRIVRETFHDLPQENNKASGGRGSGLIQSVNIQPDSRKRRRLDNVGSKMMSELALSPFPVFSVKADLLLLLFEDLGERFQQLGDLIQDLMEDRSKETKRSLLDWRSPTMEEE